MPRLRVIILDRTTTGIRYAMWADVPAARQPFYVDAAKVSAWKDALPADNTALQLGQVVEKVDTQLPEPGAGVARIRSLLQEQWARCQAEIDAANPWDKYGTSWDGTSWAAGGVA